MDWQESGELLRAYWLNEQATLRKIDPAKSSHDWMRDNHPFIYAAILYNRGHSATLIEYLRSNRPITPDDRAFLAEVLSGALAPRKHMGHPVSKEHDAALLARRFYSEWREYNERNGISDHGHANEMKDAALEFAVKAYMPGSAVDLDDNSRQKARSNMERPKSRQK